MRRQLNLMIFLALETMSPRSRGAKSALLPNFAEQRTKSPWFCGAKNEGSVISREKINCRTVPLMEVPCIWGKCLLKVSILGKCIINL